MKRSPVSSARSRSNPISIPLTGKCQYGRVRYEIIDAHRSRSPPAIVWNARSNRAVRSVWPFG